MFDFFSGIIIGAFVLTAIVVVPIGILLVRDILSTYTHLYTLWPCLNDATAFSDYP